MLTVNCILFPITSHNGVEVDNAVGKSSALIVILDQQLLFMKVWTCHSPKSPKIQPTCDPFYASYQTYVDEHGDSDFILKMQ